jgi:transcriptional regulator
MYVPDYYRPAEEDIRELLARFGAAELITATPDGLRATMLPMIHEGEATDGVLRGHFARKNDHWQQPVIGEALVIINGPDAYISPAWYATKREHGRVVPTWNYVTAHIYGDLVIHDDPVWVERNVRELTAKYEAGRQPGWEVDDAPAEYIRGQLRAIVGVELRIGRIEAKFKLSQNRSQADIDGSIEGLRAEDRSEMADSMSAVESILRK